MWKDRAYYEVGVPGIKVIALINWLTEYLVLCNYNVKGCLS